MRSVLLPQYISIADAHLSFEPYSLFHFFAVQSLFSSFQSQRLQTLSLKFHNRGQDPSHT